MSLFCILNLATPKREAMRMSTQWPTPLATWESILNISSFRHSRIEPIRAHTWNSLVFAQYWWGYYYPSWVILIPSSILDSRIIHQTSLFQVLALIGSILAFLLKGNDVFQCPLNQNDPLWALISLFTSNLPHIKAFLNTHSHSAFMTYISFHSINKHLVIHQPITTFEGICIELWSEQWGPPTHSI